MTEHEKKIRKLKRGDIVCHCNNGEPEVINEIIFDNTQGDIREVQGNRVTINGQHWYITDVTIVKMFEPEGYLPIFKEKKLT